MPRMPMAETPTNLLALRRAHLAPSIRVFQQMLALLGRQLLKMAVALHHPLSLVRRQRSKVLVGFAQMLALPGRQRAPTAQALQHLLSLLRWKPAELFEIPLR